MGLALGKTVKQLLREIDSAELTEWYAYFKLEPFGSEADFLQAGIISSVVANVNKGKNTKPFEPYDFVPSSFKAKLSKKQSPEDILAVFEAMGAKKVKRVKK